MNTRGKTHILLVDDDEVDVMVTQRALAREAASNPVVVANDGIEALEALRGAAGRAPLPRPFVVLLDLNMPRMNGLEFLAELRRDPALCDAVVFVFTTSDTPSDVRAAFRHHVAGYIVKVGAPKLGEVARLLGRYCELNEFPPN